MNRPIKLRLLTIIIRCAFSEDNKLYHQLFLHDTLYDVGKCCNTKKFMFQKKLMSIKQVHQKNVSFTTIDFFEDSGFKLEKHVLNGCHDLLTTVYSLKT